MTSTTTLRAPSPTPVVWRAGDVAEFYGVDESTVHRWERRGRIRSSRQDPGGTKYWVADEIVSDATGQNPITDGQRSTTAHPVEDLVAATRRPRRRR